MKFLTFATFIIFSLFVSSHTYAGLPDTIDKIEGSLVGVGTYGKLAQPKSKQYGTGFAVKNGQFIATNAHVIPDPESFEKTEKLVVFVGKGNSPDIRSASVVALDRAHDIAILKISGKPLSPLILSKRGVREGEDVAFTGFPISNILGLYPVTHKGIIAGITPVATPALTSKQLTLNQLRRLKKSYKVFQLDITAYPGNSGSPLYDPETGEVLAIINKVFVQSTKESVLTNPSGITYAIPVVHLSVLLSKLK